MWRSFNKLLKAIARSLKAIARDLFNQLPRRLYSRSPVKRQTDCRRYAQTQADRLKRVSAPAMTVA